MAIGENPQDARGECQAESPLAAVDELSVGHRTAAMATGRLPGTELKAALQKIAVQTAYERQELRPSATEYRFVNHAAIEGKSGHMLYGLPSTIAQTSMFSPRSTSTFFMTYRPLRSCLYHS